MAAEQGMNRNARWAIGLAGAAVWLLTFGFVIFATVVMREPAPISHKADAIVVLTGGDQRIVEGARLLGEGRGARLLISGVNPRTPREDIKKVSGLEPNRFDCCVDLGYAVNTISNADETRSWAADRRYDSLIVVTSSYHMPRTMIELERALPDTELIPYPVMPRHFRPEAWWLDTSTTRVLLGEYIKFLPAAARYGLSKIIGPWAGSSVAHIPADRRAKL